MKLLIAADIFPPESGGPATYAVTLANELTKQGVGVRIVSLNPNSDKSKVNCKISSVWFKNKLLRYFNYFVLLFINAIGVNTVYAMGPVNAGLPAWIVARILRKKFVVKVVGDYAWEQGQVSGVIKDSIDDFQKKNYGGKIGRLKKIETSVVKNADAVITPSKYLRKIVIGWGANENSVEVIYNEVEFIKGKPIEHSGENWLISVGRLVPWKGMDTLIEVIAEICKEAPEWRLKIVGDGPEMENLKKRIIDTNLTHIVELTGNLSKEKTLSYIASADVFILNSSYEGLSHVIVEAMNQGVPVLASDVGGNPESVADDNLFKYNNKEEIKEKIMRFSHVGKRGSIQHNFKLGGSKRMIDETKKLLENL